MQTAALYIRVSTEDQAIRGYSLEAQKDNLIAYAKEHEISVYDYYMDEGYSARKKYTTRKEFMRMIEDVKAHKVNVILFIKMDRWFRNVSDYYTVQKILDENGVGWIATMENYDTTTAGGRLNLNIRLSIAQNESDMTSERIKFVFDSKVSRGEVITGVTPVGLQIVNKRMLPNDEAEIVRDVFEHFEIHRNKHTLQAYILDKYKRFISRATILRMLTNELYKGTYRGQPNYCEAIIEPTRFDLMQEYAKGRSIKKVPTNRIYIFSGMLFCADCKHSMAGRAATDDSETERHYYRCNKYTTHQCTHKRLIRETAVEEHLLENIASSFKEYLLNSGSKQKAIKKQQNQKTIIQAKMTKIKDLYMNDLIGLEDYKKDYESFQRQLSEIPEVPINNETHLEKVKEMLSGDFKGLYLAMGKEDRRCFWRNAIKKIIVDSDNQITIFFE